MRKIVLAVAMLFAASAAYAYDVRLGETFTIQSGLYCDSYETFRGAAKQAQGLAVEALRKLFAVTPHCGLIKNEDVTVVDEYELPIDQSKRMRVLILERATGAYVITPAADVHIIARL